jgi:two-component system response regulator FlrC
MARKVLIVEDDAAVRAALTRMAVSVGFEVTAVATAAEALAALDGQDVVITDFDLPDAHGTVILRKIRREGRPIRTALWTANTSLPTAAESLPDAVFKKPEIDPLIAWLASL